MKLDKCDKCGTPAKERYQCGGSWLCRSCYPKDRAKEYKLWGKEKKA